MSQRGLIVTLWEKGTGVSHFDVFPNDGNICEGPVIF